MLQALNIIYSICKIFSILFFISVDLKNVSVNISQCLLCLKISNPYQSNYNILLSEYWCSAVRLSDQFTFPVRQLGPEQYLIKRIIKMDYSDLTQLWTFCYSREDTYIKINAAILDSASHLERLIQKIE